MPNIIPANSTYNIPERDRWVPKIRAGYFYIGDRPYYLFAEKQTLRVDQCRQMRINLAGAPATVTNVYLDGAPYSNYQVEGHQLVLTLEDIETYIGYWAQFVWDESRWGYYNAGFVLTDDTQVGIEYSYPTWDNTTGAFTTSSITQYTRFRDAEESYKLPTTPITNTPIVITDDSKLPTDARSYAIEFDVDYDGNITFNAPRNYISNPNFEVAPTGHPELPYDWQLLDTNNISRYEGTGYVGLWTLRMQDPTGKARTIVPLAVDEPIALSVRARMSGAGDTGIGYLELVFKDEDGYIMDTTGGIIGSDPASDVYSIRTSGSLIGTDWTEITLVAGPNDELEPTDGGMPSGIEELEVRLDGSGTGPFEFDSVQLEKSRRVSQYGYISPASTVEFEVSPTGLFLANPTGRSWPFPEYNHLDLNAASEEAHIGFLVLEEFSDQHDEDLVIGGTDISDPTGVPRGIVPRTGVFWQFGRKNLPYAELAGRRKLVNRYPLRLENQAYNEPVNAFLEPREPVITRLIVPDNTRRDGNSNLHLTVKAGTSEKVSCVFLDSYGNSVPHEEISVWVDGSGSLDSSSIYTSDSGRVMVTYTAATGAIGASVDTVNFRHVLSGLTKSLLIDTIS